MTFVGAVATWTFRARSFVRVACRSTVAFAARGSLPPIRGTRPVCVAFRDGTETNEAFSGYAKYVRLLWIRGRLS